MKTNELENKTSLYRDVSRITLEGLAKITREFEAFYQELSAKFQPALEGMAQKELPEASDQLNAIVEATENAASKIMDVLEDMQSDQEKIKTALNIIKDVQNLSDDNQVVLDGAAGASDNCMQGIMTIFEELSFQDLTGQRIKKIVALVQAVEGKVKEILNSLGDTLPAADNISGEMEKDEDPLLKGPQKKGEGMDQSAIDSLLANL